MDGARIVLIEDMAFKRRQVHDVFEGTGHEIVAEASTLDDSLALVDSMAAGELEADVMILDAHLSPQTQHGNDAREIVAAIEAHKLGIKVVGFSNCDGMEVSYGISVHADSRKEVPLLPGIVDSL